MTRVIVSFLIFAFLSTASFAVEKANNNNSANNNSVLNIAAIEKITHLKGQLDRETKIYKISVPRDDLNIVINGVKLTSAMGLTSWAVFKKNPDSTNTAMKADLVVTENQVNTVMSTALDNNLSVTGLHNHLLWESPMVMFLHVEGIGNEKTLATAIDKVFTKIRDTNDEKGDFPLAEIDASDTTLTPKKIDDVLGSKGSMDSGVYKVILNKTALSPNAVIAKSYGVSAAATFAGSDDETVIDGNLAIRTTELPKVLKALHNAGIVIVALHQQVNNEPKAIFVHYFGVGQATILAQGLRKAIDAVNLVPPAAEPATALARNMTLTMPGCLITTPMSALAQTNVVTLTPAPLEMQAKLSKPTKTAAQQTNVALALKPKPQPLTTMQKLFIALKTSSTLAVTQVSSALKHVYVALKTNLTQSTSTVETTAPADAKSLDVIVAKPAITTPAQAKLLAVIPQTTLAQVQLYATLKSSLLAEQIKSGIAPVEQASAVKEKASPLVAKVSAAILPETNTPQEQVYAALKTNSGAEQINAAINLRTKVVEAQIHAPEVIAAVAPTAPVVMVAKAVPTPVMPIANTNSAPQELHTVIIPQKNPMQEQLYAALKANSSAEQIKTATTHTMAQSIDVLEKANSLEARASAAIVPKTLPAQEQVYAALGTNSAADQVNAAINLRTKIVEAQIHAPEVVPVIVPTAPAVMVAKAVPTPVMPIANTNSAPQELHTVIIPQKNPMQEQLYAALKANSSAEQIKTATKHTMAQSLGVSEKASSLEERVSAAILPKTMPAQEQVYAALGTNSADQVNAAINLRTKVVEAQIHAPEVVPAAVPAVVQPAPAVMVAKVVSAPVMPIASTNPTSQELHAVIIPQKNPMQEQLYAALKANSSAEQIRAATKRSVTQSLAVLEAASPLEAKASAGILLKIAPAQEQVYAALGTNSAADQVNAAINLRTKVVEAQVHVPEVMPAVIQKTAPAVIVAKAVPTPVMPIANTNSAPQELHTVIIPQKNPMQEQLYAALKANSSAEQIKTATTHTMAQSLGVPVKAGSLEERASAAIMPKTIPAQEQVYAALATNTASDQVNAAINLRMHNVEAQESKSVIAVMKPAIQQVRIAEAAKPVATVVNATLAPQQSIAAAIPQKNAMEQELFIALKSNSSAEQIKTAMTHAVQQSAMAASNPLETKASAAIMPKVNSPQEQVYAALGTNSAADQINAAINRRTNVVEAQVQALKATEMKPAIQPVHVVAAATKPVAPIATNPAPQAVKNPMEQELYVALKSNSSAEQVKTIVTHVVAQSSGIANPLETKASAAIIPKTNSAQEQIYAALGTHSASDQINAAINLKINAMQIQEHVPLIAAIKPVAAQTQMAKAITKPILESGHAAKIAKVSSVAATAQKVEIAAKTNPVLEQLQAAIIPKTNSAHEQVYAALKANSAAEQVNTAIKSKTTTTPEALPIMMTSKPNAATEQIYAALKANAPAEQINTAINLKTNTVAQLAKPEAKPVPAVKTAIVSPHLAKAVNEKPPVQAAQAKIVEPPHVALTTQANPVQKQGHSEIVLRKNWAQDQIAAALGTKINTGPGQSPNVTPGISYTYSAKINPALAQAYIALKTKLAAEQVNAVDNLKTQPVKTQVISKPPVEQTHLAMAAKPQAVVMKLPAITVPLKPAAKAINQTQIAKTVIAKPTIAPAHLAMAAKPQAIMPKAPAVVVPAKSAEAMKQTQVAKTTIAKPAVVPAHLAMAAKPEAVVTKVPVAVVPAKPAEAMKQTQVAKTAIAKPAIAPTQLAMAAKPKTLEAKPAEQKTQAAATKHTSILEQLRAAAMAGQKINLAAIHAYAAQNQKAKSTKAHTVTASKTKSAAKLHVAAAPKAKSVGNKTNLASEPKAKQPGTKSREANKSSKSKVNVAQVHKSKPAQPKVRMTMKPKATPVQEEANALDDLLSKQHG